MARLRRYPFPTRIFDKKYDLFKGEIFEDVNASCRADTDSERIFANENDEGCTEG